MKALTAKLILLTCLCHTALSSPAPSSCGEAGIPAQLFERAGLLIGELHGTNEAPAFVARIACLAATKRSANARVTIALEYPRNEQAALDAFMSEADARRARSGLLRSAFWQSPERDGRASLALLELLQSVHGWQQRGLPIRVVAFDAAADAREARNAEFLAQLLRQRADQDFMVVLAGNLHARKTKGLPWDDDFEPLGYLLRDRNLLHLNMTWDGGSAWFCKGNPEDQQAAQVCGVHALAEKPPTGFTPFSIVLDQQAPEFDGVFHAGRTTASPPAAG